MKKIFERRHISLDVTQQIAMVAKLMAMQLDPANPGHAALLESMDRALFRLRKETANASRTGINLAIPGGDRTDISVLRSSDFGVDMNIEQFLKPEIVAKLPPNSKVVTDGKGAVLVEFDGGERVALHKLVNLETEAKQ